MKKIYFFAVFTAMIAVLTACGPSVQKRAFDKTPYGTITVEGSGKIGAINLETGAEILPQIYSNIGYYYSGYFVAQNAEGTALFDTDGKQVIAAVDQIAAKDDYFTFSKESAKGKHIGIYFTKTGKTVSGAYKALEVDKAGNVTATTTVGTETLYGVINTSNEVIIPLEYRFLTYDGENYNVAKDKNAKKPMIDAKGQPNWNLADAKVLGKDGKQVKKLTAAQAKKIFTAK